MTKASEIVFGGLVSRLGAGRGVGEPLEQDVGVGFQPHNLAEPGGLGRARTPGGGQAIGGRLLAERSAFRQRLVAIWNSQTRSEERPSKPARPCQAASRVS